VCAASIAGFAQGSGDFDRLNRMLSYLTTTFFAAFSPLWTAYQMAEDPSVQAMLRDLGRQQVAKTHGQLDAMLAGRDWLVGERRSVADAYFMGIARWADYHKAIDRRDYPNLHRHVQTLERDPAIVFAHAIEADRPAISGGGFVGHVALTDLQKRIAT